jgi:hypothetical protein
MSGFSIRRDIKYVQWNRTLQLTFIRAIGSSLVLLIPAIWIIWIMDPEASGMSFGELLALTPVYFFGATLGTALIYPGLGLVCWYLTSLYKYFPIFGLFGFGYIALTLPLMFGDPFTFVLHKVKPEWVPVEEYNFLNFVPIVFVVDPNHMENLRM